MAVIRGYTINIRFIIIFILVVTAFFDIWLLTIYHIEHEEKSLRRIKNDHKNNIGNKSLFQFSTVEQTGTKDSLKEILLRIL